MTAAAFAYTLAASGVKMTPDELVPQVYLPARKGSLQVEMLAAARRHGLVAYQLAPRFEETAGALLKAPWDARDDYLDVVLARDDATLRAFLDRHAVRALGDAEVPLVLRLLEMQRNAMTMFTSCGWFFDDLAGIEAVQVMTYAAAALDLAGRSFAGRLEEPFLDDRHDLPDVGIEHVGEDFATLGLGDQPLLEHFAGRPNVVDAMINRDIQLVINTPIGRAPVMDDAYIRRTAMRYQVPCVTTLTGASAAVEGIAALRGRNLGVRSLQELGRRKPTPTTPRIPASSS